MGEAKKPGPYTSFDNESDDAWSEFGDLSQLESEQQDGWLLPPTVVEAAGGETECTAAVAGERADKMQWKNGLTCMPTTPLYP